MAALFEIEGIDGSGKGTQSSILESQLREMGYQAATISFPRYTSTAFGQLIGQFLNGQFGTLENVSTLR